MPFFGGTLHKSKIKTNCYLSTWSPDLDLDEPGVVGVRIERAVVHSERPLLLLHLLLCGSPNSEGWAGTRVAQAELAVTQDHFAREVVAATDKEKIS